MKKSVVLFLTLLFVVVSPGCTASREKPEPLSVPDGTQEEEKDTQREELVPLLASDEANGVYLYGIKPSGVILYADGQGHYYDWDYSCSDYRTPRIYTGAFRSGSEHDIAVVTYTRNDGQSVEDLRILSGGDFAADAVYLVDAQEYNRYVRTAVEDFCEQETVSFVFDGKNYLFDLSESFEKFVFAGVSYSDSVTYTFEEGKIYVSIVPVVKSGDETHSYGSAEMGLTIRAQLLFDGSHISLTDFSVQGL